LGSEEFRCFNSENTCSCLLETKDKEAGAATATTECSSAVPALSLSSEPRGGLGWGNEANSNSRLTAISGRVSVLTIDTLDLACYPRRFGFWVRKSSAVSIVRTLALALACLKRKTKKLGLQPQRPNAPAPCQRSPSPRSLGEGWGGGTKQTPTPGSPRFPELSNSASLPAEPGASQLDYEGKGFALVRVGSASSGTPH
jgi:hypothetical protein